MLENLHVEFLPLIFSKNLCLAVIPLRHLAFHLTAFTGGHHRVESTSITYLIFPGFWINSILLALWADLVIEGGTSVVAHFALRFRLLKLVDITSYISDVSIFICFTSCKAVVCWTIDQPTFLWLIERAGKTCILLGVFHELQRLSPLSRSTHHPSNSRTHPATYIQIWTSHEVVVISVYVVCRRDIILCLVAWTMVMTHAWVSIPLTPSATSADVGKILGFEQLLVLVSSLVSSWLLLMKDQRAWSCSTYSTSWSKSGPTRPCMALARPASTGCTLLNWRQVFSFRCNHATIRKNLSLSSSLSLRQHLLILILVDRACILCCHIYALLHLRPVNDMLLLDWKLLLVGQVDLLILDLDATLPVVQVFQRVCAVVLRLLKVEHVFVIWVQIEWWLLVRITATPWNLLKRHLRWVLATSIEIICSFLVCAICLVSSSIWLILGNRASTHQLHIRWICDWVSMNHGSGSSSNLLEDLGLIKLSLQILRCVHRVASSCWLWSIDAIPVEVLIIDHWILDLAQFAHIGYAIICYQLGACEISARWIDIHSLILVHDMVHAIHPMILVVTQSRTLATILAAILATISASHHLECLSLALIQHSFFSSTIVELALPNLVLFMGLVLQDLFPRKVDLILLNNPIWMACCTLSCTLNVYARCFA